MVIAAHPLEPTEPGRGTRLAPGFIDRARWQDVERWCVARYLECRLAAERPELDYLMAFSRSGAKVVGPALSRTLTSASTPQREQWRPLLGLFEAWADGLSPVSLQVPTVWLEFDGIQAPGEHPGFPSLSVCLTPSYNANQPTFPNDRTRDLALIDNVLALVEVSVSAAMSSLIQRCFQRLPPNSRWIHFSVMLAREPQALKLYGVLPRQELRSYLDAVGWQGDLTTIGRVLEELYPAALLGDAVFVDLNLSTLEDRSNWGLGLAVAPQHLRSGPDSDPLRGALLKRWSQAGLASAEKIQCAHRVLLDAPNSGRFLDLKLVSSAHGTLAKAYLGFHGEPAELPWR